MERCQAPRGATTDRVAPCRLGVGWGQEDLIFPGTGSVPAKAGSPEVQKLLGSLEQMSAQGQDMGAAGG